MYSPKIADSHIPALYRLAKEIGMPMTTLVNMIIAAVLEELQNGDRTLATACRQACKKTPSTATPK